MGTLFYGAERTPIQIEDRLLAHLQLVTTSKLRRGEAFLVSWSESDGRNSIYVRPATDLHFKFSGGREPGIDQEFLERMNMASYSARGIDLDRGGPAEPGS